MTQVSELKLGNLNDVHSNGDNENCIQISGEGKSTVCVDHLDGRICN